METKTESFRKAVVTWLEAMNSNTRDLAAFAGCSESTLQKWLTNETINITLERALAIANVIGYEFEGVNYVYRCVGFIHYNCGLGSFYLIPADNWYVPKSFW